MEHDADQICPRIEIASKRRLLPALCLLAALAGCTTGNDRLRLGPASSNDQVVELAELRQAGGSAHLSAEGTHASIGRHDWPVTNVVVPVDGVSASPTYAHTRLLTAETTRQRGDFPNALSALELEGGTGWTQYGEIGYAPIQVACDFVMLVPRMFVNGPGEELPVKPRQIWRAPVVISRVPYASSEPAQDASGERPPERPETAPTSRPGQP